MNCDSDAQHDECGCGCAGCADHSADTAGSSPGAPVAVWWTEWQTRALCSHAPPGAR